jgi:hypothetical protein
MKRERNAKDAKGNGKSQTKIVCFPSFVYLRLLVSGERSMYTAFKCGDDSGTLRPET